MASSGNGTDREVAPVLNRVAREVDAIIGRKPVERTEPLKVVRSEQTEFVGDWDVARPDAVHPLQVLGHGIRMQKVEADVPESPSARQ